VTSKIEISKLRPEDRREDFHSGNDELDRFFHRYAGQNQFRHHIGTTYVAKNDKGTILGFVTLSASEIISSTHPSKRKKNFAYPLPVLRLARLAVSSKAQGSKVGEKLLKMTFEMAKKMSSDIGCVGVVVDAKAEAKTYYERYGFSEIPVEKGKLFTHPQTIMMFLSIKEIPS